MSNEFNGRVICKFEGIKGGPSLLLTYRKADDDGSTTHDTIFRVVVIDGKIIRTRINPEGTERNRVVSVLADVITKLDAPEDSGMDTTDMRRMLYRFAMSYTLIELAHMVGTSGMTPDINDPEIEEFIRSIPVQ